MTDVTDLWPLLDLKEPKGLQIAETPVEGLRPISYLDALWENNGQRPLGQKAKT